MFDLAANLTVRLDDVLGLRSDALVVRSTDLGTDRTTGGAFERQFIQLWLFGADGLVTRDEMFDADRDAEALARFDELTAEPPAPRFANAATRSFDAFARCWNARDWEGVVALYAPTVRLMDRRSLTGVDLEGGEYLQNLRVIFDMGASRYCGEPLATRGDRLALFRWRMEGESETIGPTELEYVGIVEVDADGRGILNALFDAQDLDAAWTELDARFAAGQGAPHAELLAHLRAFLQAFDARDDDAIRRVLPDDLTWSDHRRFVGTEGPVGRDEWLASFRNLGELGEFLSRIRVDHIPRLSTTAGVIAVTASGTVAGGAFERPGVVVFAHDGSRLRSLEEFDLEQLGAALARYEELTAVPPPPSTRIENAATRALRRGLEAWQARDWDGFAARLAVGFRGTDRRRLIRLELDRDEFVASYRPLVEMTTGFSTEVLATRGERLAMMRVVWEGADPSIGPSEIESLAVAEIDGHGDAVAIVEFDPDDLDAAYAELDARYGAPELPAFLRDFHARDWDAVAAQFAPDLVVEDHRRLGWETLHGAAAYLEAIQGLVELAPDARMRVDHAEESDRRALVIATTLGTREGGAFEIPRIVVLERDAQRRTRRMDMYDLDQLDEARASFDAIGTSRDPLAALARPNAATAAMDRVQAVFEARDWAGLRAACAPEATIEDRRSHARVSGNVDRWIEEAQRNATPDLRVERQLVGTAGDRAALERHLWRGGPIGGFEIECLFLSEVDEAGRIVSGVCFDLDDWRAAYREALGRWLARDAAASAVMGPAFEVIEGFNDQDLARLRASLADDVVFHDHRLTGQGHVEGVDAYLDSIAVLLDLVPDAQLEPRLVLALERHGMVAVARNFGTFPEGGAFEVHMVTVSTVARGRVTRMELFELEAAAAALARFAELRPDPLRIPPNAATRTADRHEEAIQARDMEALSQLCAPTMIFDDRRRGVLLCGDRDMFLASSRITAAARLSRTLLATAGDRLSLEHLHWSGGAAGQDWETENLSIHQVDAEGRTIAIIAFDPDARRAASRELFERHARSEAGRGMPEAGLELWRAFLDRDFERCRAAIPADFVYHDHRRTGPGRIEGADAWMAWNAALLEQAPDAISEPLYYVASEEHGSLAMGHTFGTLAGGGAFESVFLSLWHCRGGRPVALERFEPEDLDLARARFEELRATVA